MAVKYRNNQTLYAGWSKPKEHIVICVPLTEERFDLIIKTLKLINGKWFDKTSKKWYVPIESYVDVVSLSRRFEIRPTRELIDKIKEYKKSLPSEEGE